MQVVHIVFHNFLISFFFFFLPVKISEECLFLTSKTVVSINILFSENTFLIKYIFQIGKLCFKHKYKCIQVYDIIINILLGYQLNFLCKMLV